jgi:Na+/H+ antiporter NhaC
VLLSTGAFAWQVDLPAFSQSGENVSVGVSNTSSSDTVWVQYDGLEQAVSVGPEENRSITLPASVDSFTVQDQSQSQTYSLNSLPGLWSLLPPLIAIVLALIFKEVVTSLFLGLISGGFLIGWFRGDFWFGMKESVQTILNAVVPRGSGAGDQGHFSVILFSLLIAAMVQVITKNGGMNAMVKRITRYATTPRSGLLTTWGLGVAIFFDDYANTLIVGNSMRPITDRLKISREKLAYVVDSTAAPVAAIALVTTWIGAELGYIDEGLRQIKGLANQSAYGIFLSSLKYSFYPILTLAFILLLILTGKDFGPMKKTRPQMLEEEKEEDKVTGKTYYAIIPVIILVFGTLLGLYVTGRTGPGQSISEIIGNADSYSALIWASLTALVISVLISIIPAKMPLVQTMEAVIEGFKTMMGAMVILVLAWSLAEMTTILGTADYLATALSGGISPYLLPSLAFVLAAVVSFSTGSSWGTMALLYPLVIGTTWEIAIADGLAETEALPLLVNAISCVMAGSVLGDHCSPISDTTILSSMATQCDHIQHVRTQMPYALTVGGVSLVFGTLGTAYGLPIWLAYLLGFVILAACVSYLGQKPEESGVST